MLKRLIATGFLLLSALSVLSADSRTGITSIITIPGGSNGDVQINDRGIFGGRTLTAGSNVTITTAPTTITIAATGGGGGTPAGAHGEMQFNNDGAFGSDDHMYFSTDTRSLTIYGTGGNLSSYYEGFALTGTSGKVISLGNAPFGSFSEKYYFYVQDVASFSTGLTLLGGVADAGGDVIMQFGKDGTILNEEPYLRFTNLHISGLQIIRSTNTTAQSATVPYAGTLVRVDNSTGNVTFTMPNIDHYDTGISNCYIDIQGDRYLRFCKIDSSTNTVSFGAATANGAAVRSVPPLRYKNECQDYQAVYVLECGGGDGSSSSYWLPTGRMAGEGIAVSTVALSQIAFADGTTQTTAGGGGGSDNLGNHIATMTLTAAYGINATTADFTTSITVGPTGFLSENYHRILPNDDLYVKNVTVGDIWTHTFQGRDAGGGGGTLRSAARIKAEQTGASAGAVVGDLFLYVSGGGSLNRSVQLDGSAATVELNSLSLDINDNSLFFNSSARAITGDDTNMEIDISTHVNIAGQLYLQQRGPGVLYAVAGSSVVHSAATGVINTSTNPVDWSLLKNVPAEFADGTDDTSAGGGDNLGNHIATMTLTASFGISMSTLTVTSLSPGVMHIVEGSSNVVISLVDISTETNLGVTAPIVLTGDTLSLTQNAGTDVTADLEEEAHASEHQNGGADEIEVTGLSGLLADPQEIRFSTGGTFVSVSTGINIIAGTQITITGAETGNRFDLTITNGFGADIDLGSSEATGTLAAGRFPALTGDVSNSAGSLTITVLDDSHNHTVATSTFAVTGGTFTVTGGTVSINGIPYRFPNTAGANGTVLHIGTFANGVYPLTWDTDDTGVGGSGVVATDTPTWSGSHYWTQIATVNFSNATNLLIPQGTDVSGKIAWGSISIDTDNARVYIGTGTSQKPLGGNINIQVFTTTGTYTPHPAMAYARVIVTGPGASGNIAANTDSNTGGGGAGATCIGLYSRAQLDPSQAIGIGAAPAAGLAGSPTTFGSLITANGGSLSSESGTSTTVGVQGAGGQGGTCTGGDIQIAGGDGTNGVQYSGANGQGGMGGASYWGGGGKGSGTDAVGIAGKSWGSGGGGAHAPTTTDRNGGAGKEGVVYIMEFLN